MCTSYLKDLQLFYEMKGFIDEQRGNKSVTESRQELSNLAPALPWRLICLVFVTKIDILSPYTSKHPILPTVPKNSNSEQMTQPSS